MFITRRLLANACYWWCFNTSRNVEWLHVKPSFQPYTLGYIISMVQVSLLDLLISTFFKSHNAYSAVIRDWIVTSSIIHHNNCRNIVILLYVAHITIHTVYWDHLWKKIFAKLAYFGSFTNVFCNHFLCSLISFNMTNSKLNILQYCCVMVLFKHFKHKKSKILKVPCSV